MSYKMLKYEQRGKVVVIRLHRPDALNALSLDLREELREALVRADEDAEVGAIIITGDDKAFAAGADVKAICNWTREQVASTPEFRGAWAQMERMQKPVIAAVAGFALGAGCELAMMCDFILAADNAKFGQPEIKLGTIPGSGGTQRLARLVGKSKAMEMILTGRMIEAEEAERCGLVSRVVPLAEFDEEAMRVASKIAELSVPVVRLARQAVNAALQTTLADGLRKEREYFEETFTLADRSEGMAAFLEKRKPIFKNI